MIRRTGFVLLLLLGSTGVALACTCASATLSQRHARADNVFRAIITSAHLAPVADDYGNDQVLMTFDLLDRFKGELPFSALHSSGFGGACGVSLDVGMAYLVFVGNDGRVNTCSGVQALGGPSGAYARQTLSVLERHRRGELADLPEPWLHVAQPGRCYLRTHVELFPWRTPRSLTIDFDDGRRGRRPPRLRLMLQLDPGADLSAHAVSLAVDGRSWSVPWDGAAKGHALHDEAVRSLLAALREAPQAALEMAFDHPRHGLVLKALGTGHAVDTFRDFDACVAALE